jgi:hypothetical protein
MCLRPSLLSTRQRVNARMRTKMGAARASLRVKSGDETTEPRRPRTRRSVVMRQGDGGGMHLPSWRNHHHTFFIALIIWTQRNNDEALLCVASIWTQGTGDRWLSYFSFSPTGLYCCLCLSFHLVDQTKLSYLMRNVRQECLKDRSDHIRLLWYCPSQGHSWLIICMTVLIDHLYGIPDWSFV